MEQIFIFKIFVRNHNMFFYMAQMIRAIGTANTPGFVGMSAWPIL